MDHKPFSGSFGPQALGAFEVTPMEPPRRRSINQSLLTLGRVITALREAKMGPKGAGQRDFGVGGPTYDGNTRILRSGSKAHDKGDTRNPGL